MASPDLLELIHAVRDAIDQELSRQFQRKDALNLDLVAAAAVRRLLLWLDDHPHPERKAMH
jgi:hypothetical protein